MINALDSAADNRGCSEKNGKGGNRRVEAEPEGGVYYREDLTIQELPKFFSPKFY